MAGVSAPGIGSGLDINAIITQLMQIEQQPLNAVNTRQSGIRSQISAFGQLSSALAALKTAAKTLNTPSKTGAQTGTLSDTTFGTATASSSAAAGAYALVINHLASAHTIAVATPYAADTTVVGEGTLDITAGGSSFSVTIDSSNHTLAGIRDAINSATGNTTVNASIITDSSGARLVLSAKNTGLANSITSVVSTGTLSALDYTSGSPNWTEGNPGQDADLTINGIPISSASNTISTAITGVTLNLAKSGSVTLTVARDTAAVTKAANDFAAAYTSLSSTIKSLTAFDTTSRKGSVLTGDGTASLIQSRVRSTLTTVPSSLTGQYTTLSDVGFSIAADGSMTVDSTKLEAALGTNFTDFQSVLGAYGQAISDVADSLTNSTGAVTSRVDGLNSTIRRLDDRKVQIQSRLDRIEANYRRQFSALDALLGSMTTTSNFLTQQLARL